MREKNNILTVNNTQGLHKFTAATFRVKNKAPIEYAGVVYNTSGLRADEEMEENGRVIERYDFSASESIGSVYLYCAYEGTSATVVKAITPEYKSCELTYREEKGLIKDTKVSCK